MTPPRPHRSLLLLPLLLALAVLSACSGSPSSDAATGASGTGADPAVQRYVALGDSYSSAPLVPVTDVANGCFRSSHNYPTLIAKKLGADLTDVSCGGARTSDFAHSQHPDVPPQLAALTRDTQLVTVGIGGNDEHVFSRLVNTCPGLRSRDPQGAPCAAYMQRRGGDALLDALRRSSASVVSVLREVKKAAPDARVLVIGYPQIVDPAHRCARLPLAAGDYAYGERVNRALTEALRTAARRTGTTYVDVWAASKGHDICSSDPWVNGSVTDQQRAAAFHPFAAEQQAVAALVLRALRG
jgi:hypothetical protein